MNLTKTQIDSAKNVVCEKCKCEVLKQVFVVKSISGLLMQDGKDTYVPVPVFACNTCSHVNDVFAKDVGITASGSSQKKE